MVKKILSSFILLIFSFSMANANNENSQKESRKDDYIIMNEIKEVNPFKKFFKALYNSWKRYNTYYSVGYYRKWEPKRFEWPNICFRTNPKTDFPENYNWKLYITLKKVNSGNDFWTQYIVSNWWHQYLKWNNVWRWEFYFVFEKNKWNYDKWDIYDYDAIIEDC